MGEPQTLGEYRDLWHALAPGSPAVAWMDEKIAAQGRGETVVMHPTQMLYLFSHLNREWFATREPATA